MCARKVRRKKKRKKIGCLLLLLLLFIPVIVITFSNVTDPSIETFAKLHGLSEDEWPRELIEMLEKNPEAKDYVLNYPLKKDMDYEVDLSELSYSESVPLLMQWDERWGYTTYGSDFLAVTGCGPTCLSMVAAGLSGDNTITPYRVAQFAQANGYYVDGSGTDWSLMRTGCQEFGLLSEQIALTEFGIAQTLANGTPIICSMLPGDFTTSGHFIVLVGVENGKIRVHDPNSIIRSEKLWDYNELAPQIANLWKFYLSY